MTRLDRALTQYTRAAVRIDTVARRGGTTTTDAVAMLRTRRLWEAEARTHGATTADLDTARRTATA